MVKAGAVFTFVAILMLAFVPGAQALVITDTSWNWTCIAVCNGLVSGAAVEANVAVPWAPETTGQWITASNTTKPGVNGIVEFTKLIDFGTTGSTLSIKVWADDTASVTLGGGVLTFLNPGLAPNLGPPDAACANGVLGCEDDEFGSFSSNVLTGNHLLTVRVHQLVAATSYGALVEGDTLAAVPEPTTILLLGSALATAGVFSRKRFRKAASKA